MCQCGSLLLQIEEYVPAKFKVHLHILKWKNIIYFFNYVNTRFNLDVPRLILRVLELTTI
jgi:hypothetical protein